MIRSPYTIVLLAGLALSLGSSLVGQSELNVSPRFKALSYTPPPTAGTWKVLDRDGANRKVTPYLSSLGLGEGGTGVITSPPFTVASPVINLTLRGHDGPDGERKKNFVALVDAETGETLRKTFAPLSDPLKERSWNVENLQGRRVRFEAHDHDTEGAFAWLGVGRIDAGERFRVDFQEGFPKNWTAIAEKRSVRYEEIQGGGVPFLSLVSHESMIPKAGAAEIPCGFSRAEALLPRRPRSRVPALSSAAARSRSSIGTDLARRSRSCRVHARRGVQARQRLEGAAPPSVRRPVPVLPRRAAEGACHRPHPDLGGAWRAERSAHHRHHL